MRQLFGLAPDGQDEFCQLGLESVRELFQCRICGTGKPSLDFTECAESCDQCLAEEREVKFQEALNEMPAGFVLTFSLLVDAYKNTLAEKEKSGENINLLIQFAKTAQEYKHTKIHA
jgi:hypothetical protein